MFKPKIIEKFSLGGLFGGGGDKTTSEMTLKKKTEIKQDIINKLTNIAENINDTYNEAVKENITNISNESAASAMSKQEATVGDLNFSGNSKFTSSTALISQESQVKVSLDAINEAVKTGVFQTNLENKLKTKFDQAGEVANKLETDLASAVNQSAQLEQPTVQGNNIGLGLLSFPSPFPDFGGGTETSNISNTDIQNKVQNYFENNVVNKTVISNKIKNIMKDHIEENIKSTCFANAMSGQFAEIGNVNVSGNADVNLNGLIDQKSVVEAVAKCLNKTNIGNKVLNEIGIDMESYTVQKQQIENEAAAKVVEEISQTAELTAQETLWSSLPYIAAILGGVIILIIVVKLVMSSKGGSSLKSGMNKSINNLKTNKTIGGFKQYFDCGAEGIFQMGGSLNNIFRKYNHMYLILFVIIITLKK